jgi:RimJ/RimL family protein N-acetyltransferase
MCCSAGRRVCRLGSGLTNRLPALQNNRRIRGRQSNVSSIPAISTKRLKMEAFAEGDIPAVAAILAEPDVTKNITANGSTPERCLASAAARISRHNKSWAERGYGVWAVKARDDSAAPRGGLLGWCGFAEPDVGEDPEILYGYAPDAWGRGLAQEAARAAIDWLFAETSHGGVSAIIFGRLNPVSVAIAGKFGMKLRGTMSMPDFLPDRALAEDVLDYEIWRLGHGRTRDLDALLFQAPYKGGQIATLGLRDTAAVEQAFCDAASQRNDCVAIAPTELDRRVRQAFQQGMAEPYLDWYHVPRADWRANRSHGERT